MDTNIKNLALKVALYSLVFSLGLFAGYGIMHGRDSGQGEARSTAVVTSENLDEVIGNFYITGLAESASTGVIIRDSSGQEALAESSGSSVGGSINSGGEVSVVSTGGNPDVDLSADPEVTYLDRRNPFVGASLHVSQHDPAGWTAAEWDSTDPYGASQLRKISGQPIGVWLGRWSTSSYIGQIMNSATAKGETPIFVIYGMPSEGCSGLPSSANDYLSWVQMVSNTIGNRSVILIVEPDELAITNCSSAQEDQRLAVLSDAVDRLRANTKATLYIDAGHSNWVSADEMTQRLIKAGVQNTQGFSLNVSNYRSTAESRNYGEQLSARLDGAKYVIDTSRNGLGPTADNEWCNAPGRALGEQPGAANSGNHDGNIWIKYPGESDLACNGGPAEGQWWPEYAVGLAERAAW